MTAKEIYKEKLLGMVQRECEWFNIQIFLQEKKFHSKTLFG